jgi:hypothetical protein
VGAGREDIAVVRPLTGKKEGGLRGKAEECRGWLLRVDEERRVGEKEREREARGFWSSIGKGSRLESKREGEEGGVNGRLLRCLDYRLLWMERGQPEQRERVDNNVTVRTSWTRRGAGVGGNKEEGQGFQREDRRRAGERLGVSPVSAWWLEWTGEAFNQSNRGRDGRENGKGEREVMKGKRGL